MIAYKTLILSCVFRLTISTVIVFVSFISLVILIDSQLQENIVIEHNGMVTFEIVFLFIICLMELSSIFLAVKMMKLYSPFEHTSIIVIQTDLQWNCALITVRLVWAIFGGLFAIYQREQIKKEELEHVLEDNPYLLSVNTSDQVLIDNSEFVFRIAKTLLAFEVVNVISGLAMQLSSCIVFT